MSQNKQDLENYEAMMEKVKKDGFASLFQKPELKTDAPLQWRDLKLDPPRDDNQLCAFICSHNGIPILGSVRTLGEAKIWRKYELKEQWTHWLGLPNL